MQLLYVLMLLNGVLVVPLIDGRRINSTREDNLKKLTWSLMYSRFQNIPPFPTTDTLADVSDQCKEDSRNYRVSYEQKVNWALRMHESTGRLTIDGLMVGGNTVPRSFGLFDECIDTRGPLRCNTTDESTLFDGKYCSVFFNVEILKLEELSLILGKNVHLNENPKLTEPKERKTTFAVQQFLGVDFCIPSSCSADDFRRAVSGFVGQEVIFTNVDDNNKTHYYSIVTYADDGWCYTRETVDATPNFDGPDIVVVVTLSLMSFLALAASCHEAFRLYTERPIDAKRDSLAVRYLHCFSVINNGKKLLSTKAPPGNLTCLNGIRVLSITWVILGHTYFVAVRRTMYNIYQILQEAYQWQMQSVVNAGLSVDTFYLMSGLLVTLSLLRELDRRNGRFNIPLFYIHRYLRLTPIFAVILGFVATLLVYVSTGPNWRLVHYMKEGCRWNWWNNLLYIHNYFSSSPIGMLQCMGETWYLATEMQMFIVSPLIILPLWRWRRAGFVWALLCFFTLAGGLVTIFIIWELPAAALPSRPIEMRNPHRTPKYYIQMWTRFPPYMVGILLGYILHQTKNNTIKINKFVVACGWTLATAVALAIIYGLVPYLNETEVPEMNSFVRVSYGALHRLAWSIVVGWIIFACVHGYGGPINRFLSWKAFVPLSRLTYVVYLIHFTYLMVWSARLRKPIYYTDLDHVQFYLGVVFGLNLLAFAISLTIEAPLMNLEKIMLNRFMIGTSVTG